MDKTRILILAGTTEARQLAARLAPRADLALTLSLAGRTGSPAPLPAPMRIGGFGGAEGLADYLASEAVDLLVDATHPFAARISGNAATAAVRLGLPLLRLERPGWEPQEGDRWTMVPSVGAAIAALGAAPRRVFLAIGRQEAAAALAAPQHHYLIRSVDPVSPPLALPQVDYLLARGPFEEAAERALLQERQIEVVVCKNSGGAASHAKLAAARALGLPLIMVARPPGGAGPVAQSVDEAVALLDQLAAPGSARGV